MNYLIGGEIPVREGTGHPNIVPYQTFSTNDGEIMLAIGNDGQFKRLMTVLNETNTKFTGVLDSLNLASDNLLESTGNVSQEIKNTIESFQKESNNLYSDHIINALTLLLISVINSLYL